MGAQEERELIAAQLAELTRAVERMSNELVAVRERADVAQERANVQQDGIEVAARELAEVSARLHAAANALRESI